MQAVDFRKLDLDGVKILVEWAKAEGWNPGPYDAEIFFQTDPDGFYGYFLGDEMIGGGSIVAYGHDFGFMGFFIVKPGHRSKGLGRKLWYLRRDALLSRLRRGASIGMDGVLAMQPFYAKGGFKIAFRDERHMCIGERYSIDRNISEITNADIDEILKLDEECFGFPRPQFMKSWLMQPGGTGHKYSEHGRLQGFSFMRKASKGYKICPLFANTRHIAESLFKASLNSVQGEPLFIDIPMSNPNAVSLIDTFDTEYVFECARMYYGEPPKQAQHKVYGITTFELG